MPARRAIDVSVQAKDFVDLFGASSKVHDALKRRLRKNIRSAADELADDVRAEVDRIPSSGRDSHAVRAGIRRGIKVSINARGGQRVGVFIVGDSSGLAERQRGLQIKFNRDLFKHPAFARGPRGEWHWVGQHGHPYFDKPIIAGLDRVRVAVESALDQAANDAGVTRHY